VLTEGSASVDRHGLDDDGLDGAVAGTWRHDGGRIALEPFARLDGATLRELRAAAEGLESLYA